MRIISSFFVRKKHKKVRGIIRSFYGGEGESRKWFLKTAAVLGSIACLTWGSVLVIFARNSEVSKQAVTSLSSAVDPNLAIIAAGIAALAGIIVYAKRNRTKEKG